MEIGLLMVSILAQKLKVIKAIKEIRVIKETKVIKGNKEIKVRLVIKVNQLMKSIVKSILNIKEQKVNGLKI